MDQKQVDSIVYTLLCIATFGFAYVVRLVVTVAIRKSK
jgi:hypothetical protein